MVATLQQKVMKQMDATGESGSYLHVVWAVATLAHRGHLKLW